MSDMQRFIPNFGEQAEGISDVILPLGDRRAIERLARDLIAFGYGMGEAPAGSSDRLNWMEKAENAKTQLLANVDALLCPTPSPPEA